MKIYVIALILFMIQISTMMLHATVDVNTLDAVPLPFNQSGVIDGSASIFESFVDISAFWQFVANPTNWTNTNLIKYLLAFIIFITLSGATIVGFTAISSDTVRFGPLFAIIFAIGSMPIVSLWNMIQKDVTAVACATGQISCWMSWMVPFIIVTPLTLIWFFACISHWRTGLTTA